jgi:amidase
MTQHIFTPHVFYNAIGLGEPALVISDGDSVVTQTLDAWGFDATGLRLAEPPNPMTGPFFINGAEAGDALEIQIDRMTPTRDTGWTFSPVAGNVVNPATAATLPQRSQAIWRLDANSKTARLEDAPDGLEQWSVPFAPMIGCFGVAPPLSQAISTATSGQYGGNMDYRGFGPGAIARFPVSALGALFYVGDCHAVQGDGEIVGNGIETSFEIEFTVRILKARKIGWPRGETSNSIFTVGNARPLDQALQHATSEMLEWLREEFGLEPIAASHILGQCVRYDIANAFNPAYSVVCRLSKQALPHARRGDGG